MFRNVAPGDLAVLAGSARPLYAQRGEILVRRGERMTSLLAVGYGMLKLALSSAAGGEKLLRLVGPGETFGEAVLFLERPAPVDAIAVVDTMVAALPAASLLSMLERNAHLARTLLAGMSQRLHALVSDFERATLHGAHARVAAYLDSLAPPGDEPCMIGLPATKTLIAARLGMTKETLSRVLRALAEASVVHVDKRRIVLLDRRRLRHRSGYTNFLETAPATASQHTAT